MLSKCTTRLCANFSLISSQLIGKRYLFRYKQRFSTDKLRYIPKQPLFGTVEDLRWRPFRRFVLVGLSVGWVVTTYKYFSSWDALSSLFPAVKAAQKVDTSAEPKVSPRTTLNFIVDIVEKITPSVVFIETIGTRETLFGTAVVEGNGSGFIVRSDGLILTNAHVVQRARKVRVRMYNDEYYDGVVQYYDPVSDLATVKINAKDLPVLKLANSKEAKAGEMVIAVGSPMSLSNSVTFGIISNSMRKLNEQPMTYIQTDAAITIGNSGGPLVNLDGEAVGINSMTVAGTSGISFAIPSDHAKEFLDSVSTETARKKKGIMESLIKSRKYLGVTMFALDSEVLRELKLRNKDFPKNVDHGILVHTVELGSPANKGGLEPGDIIVEVDGKPIYSSQEMLKIIQNSSSRLTLVVVRNSKTLKLVVKPEDEL